LIWSGEDAWETVLVPRLIAAGADLDMVGRLSIASHIDGNTCEVTPKLPLDTGTLSDAAAATGAVLVLIDPIASTMSGDLHREADVRAAVDALARVSGETGAVTMFVRHFGKGGGNASDKMSGSHAFRDAVRSVFLFAEDGDRVIVSQDKGNYAPTGEESFAFRLESVTIPTDDGPAEVARVVELGSSDVSVNDVINRSTGPADDDADVDAWLTTLLANGSVRATEVFSAADAAGHSKDQAKRAKKRLGVEAVREAAADGNYRWFWKLETRGADDQGSTPNSPHSAPLLPSTSEGVREAEKRPREHSPVPCSLDAPLPSIMPARGNHAALITSTRRRRTRGKHRCACGVSLERPESIQRGKCAECALSSKQQDTA